MLSAIGGRIGHMLETSARLLRLLALLQTRREWSGPELAERLGVSTRTVRRDVDKLRGLDYPVEAGMGTTGGYRLGAGARLPPLLLDDDEAVAVAVTLRTAAGAGVQGLGETALRALMKLEQVLPSRLRHRVAAVPVATVDVPGTLVDAEVLTAVGSACRDRRRLRFAYRSHDASSSQRHAEPHHLVSWGRRWYLVAWDVDRAGWRTFRVDRLTPRLGPDGLATGARFEPRELPGGDPAAFVSDQVADVWPCHARVRVLAPAAAVAAGLWTLHARIEEIDAGTCLLHVSAETPRMVAFLLTVLDHDFVVEHPPELADDVRRLSERFGRATRSASVPRSPSCES